MSLEEYSQHRRWQPVAERNLRWCDSMRLYVKLATAVLTGVLKQRREFTAYHNVR
jgi:hypothetical protein